MSGWTDWTLYYAAFRIFPISMNSDLSFRCSPGGKLPQDARKQSPISIIASYTLPLTLTSTSSTRVPIHCMCNFGAHGDSPLNHPTSCIRIESAPRRKLGVIALRFASVRCARIIRLFRSHEVARASTDIERGWLLILSCECG
jgi:hypothetical protein